MPYANTYATPLLSISFHFLGISVTLLKKLCHLVFEKAVSYIMKSRLLL